MIPNQSFDLKFDRAETHLIELERLITEYVSSHPYTMRPGRKTKRKPNPWHLTFTAQPNETISVVIGDFIHNVRSGLDHLAASLVPGARRSKVMFPILWQGVWEPSVPEEDEQRTKDRDKWIAFTKKMNPDAIRVLQQLQPGEPRHTDNTLTGHSMPGLVGLNRLSNHDKHSKLIVTASALSEPVELRAKIDGNWEYFAPTGTDPRQGYHDGAPFHLPDGAMDVEIHGTPCVTVRITFQDVGYIMPGVFKMLLGDSRMIATILRPYMK